MTYYVIGSGYLATLFRDGCLESGISPVVVTDRRIEDASSTSKVLPVKEFLHGLGLGHIRADLIINATGPGNAAIQQQEADAWLARQSAFAENLGSCRAKARVVLVSSGGTVYGEQHRSPISERSELRGSTPYARYQIAIEALHQHVFQSGLTILRVANPYGVHQFGKSGQGFVSTLIRNLLSNQITTVFGDGGLVRDYFFEEDLYSLIPLLKGPRADGIFNIGSGVGRSQGDVVRAVTAVFGKQPSLAFAPGRLTDLRYNCLDNRAAAETLGWHASTSLEQGLATMQQGLRGAA